MYVKAFIINVNKWPETFFSRLTHQYCKKESRVKAVGRSVATFKTTEALI